MTRWILPVLLVLTLSVGGVVSVPVTAAAQALDEGPTITVLPLDEFCEFERQFLEGLEEADIDLEEQLEDLDEVALWEPEPIDDARADDAEALASAFDELLALHEDADEGTATLMDIGGFLVTLSPALERCEDLPDIEYPEPFELEPGFYIIEPGLEEFCEEVAVDVEDVEAVEVEEDEAVEEPEAEAVLELPPPREPTEQEQPLVDQLESTLQGLVDGSPDAAQGSVTYDGDVLVLDLTPTVDDCPDFEPAPVDGVPAGGGGTAGTEGSVVWLLAFAAAAGLMLAALGGVSRRFLLRR